MAYFGVIVFRIFVIFVDVACVAFISLFFSVPAIGGHATVRGACGDGSSPEDARRRSACKGWNSPR